MKTPLSAWKQRRAIKSAKTAVETAFWAYRASYEHPASTARIREAQREYDDALDRLGDLLIIAKIWR